MALTKNQMGMKPQINKEGYIINLPEILELISIEENQEFLEDYLDEIKSYDKDFPGKLNITSKMALINALTIKAKELGASDKISLKNQGDKKEDDLMSLTEFAQALNDLISLKELSIEQIQNMNAYARFLIEKMQKESISFEEQNAIDTYAVYLTEHDFDSEILEYYNKVVETYKKQKLEANSLTQTNQPKMLKLVPLNPNHDSKGIILAITILEVTTLMGLFISILAIVKS